MTTARAQKQTTRQVLLRLVEEAYRRATWNGTNLQDALNDVNAKEAAWVPEHGQHAIVDHVVHCAYWKHIVRRRLTGERKRNFPLPGSDWPDVPAPLTEANWREYLELLDAKHAELVATIRDLDVEDDFGSDAARKHVRQIIGAASHDFYHTGQIRQLRAMHRRAP